MKSRSFLYRFLAASASSTHKQSASLRTSAPPHTVDEQMEQRLTVELEICTPRLARELLLPLVVLLNRVVPILLSLNVLATFFCISFEAEGLCELPLSLETCCFSSCDFLLCTFFDYVCAVCTRCCAL